MIASAPRAGAAPGAQVDLAFDRGLAEAFDRTAVRRCVRRMVAAAAATEGRGLEAAFRFTRDPAIHALNRDYRAKDQPTDVLAFAQREGPPGATDAGVLGDVIISVETARRQAKRRGPAGLTHELCFLAAHGLCHLLGYDHPTARAERIMNARMAALLAAAAAPGPVRAA
ncbi:MAG: rRNA maturation RNase YbeY [Myxococcales bacterium]|nr:rRNA maturation RNase YbeY [Myxococcales bacterium]